MAIAVSAGTERAKELFNSVPDNFNAFCHMDQMTFTRLADWCMWNADSEIPYEITIEECLFVFLDIVAQGNSIKAAACGWNHDIQLTKNIFLTVLNALCLLREREELSDSCPMLSTTKGRWRVLRSFRPGKMKSFDGLIKIGAEDDDGVEIRQEQLNTALTALNNFIHENRDY